MIILSSIIENRDLSLNKWQRELCNFLEKYLKTYFSHVKLKVYFLHILILWITNSWYSLGELNSSNRHKTLSELNFWYYWFPMDVIQGLGLLIFRDSKGSCFKFHPNFFWLNTNNLQLLYGMSQLKVAIYSFKKLWLILQSSLLSCHPLLINSILKN